MKVLVDLFCGCGGFGYGAQMAGVETVLAVDSDPDALRIHETHFPNAKRIKAELGSQASLEQMLEEIGALPHSDIHIHASPPCTNFSRAKRKHDDKSSIEGNRLLRFAIRLIKLVRPASWSIEEVNSKAVRRCFSTLKMPQTDVDYQLYGVPQSRNRILACSHIHHVWNSRDKYEGVKGYGEILGLPETVVATPSQWSLERIKQKYGFAIKNEKMKQYSKISARGWNEVCFSVTAGFNANRLWLDGKITGENDENTRYFTLSEICVLQTFPSDYLPDTIPKYLGLKLIGNATPPAFSYRLMSRFTLSPS